MRISRIRSKIEEHLRRVGRKRRTHGDPNDRGVDHQLEAKLKRLRPEHWAELDDLEDEDDVV